ncbi:hypothetical protein PtB15_6B692 [Puccinia triticina]|nr:hypothetical protein PtB15_6B692 [Puccinia triticina]
MALLPVITIQHDFPEVIADIKNEVCLAEDIWISCYTLTSGATTRSVHGKVRVTADTDAKQSGRTLHDLPISLQGRDGVECEWAAHASYSQLAIIVTCDSLSIPPTLVSFPSQALSGVQPNGVECMDLAGDWVVTGGKNGKLRADRWRPRAEPSTPDIGHEHRIGKGHLSDLTSCQFFPSGKVILTTSIDMSARIFFLDEEINSEGQPTKQMMNARTLGPPHGRGLIGAGMLGKGKEIVTGCRDGKLRIWNVGSAKVEHEAEWPGAASDELLALVVGEKRVLDPMGESLPSAESQGRIIIAHGLHIA